MQLLMSEALSVLICSAAGVGSGDFHIYRGLRRREYARLEFIEEQKKQQAADEEFQKLREERIKEFEAKTAKKRQKRLKKKERRKRKKGDNGSQTSEHSDGTDDENSTEENPTSEDKKEQ
ncbi:unnamed protein product [Dibothriocephalus latus]|uniref:PRKR-interacting protein 1 homolog n=1 Tax=Dibothriocephalus latus TaxID=60516 RepID=A0A3P7P9C3_DIBLA|nr:unnamed protein product [Dibothriocephalus latus]